MPSRLIKLEQCLAHDEHMKRFVYIQFARLYNVKLLPARHVNYLAKKIKPQHRLRKEALTCIQRLYEQS